MLTPEKRSALIQAALDVRVYAYAPYSHYRVGAALLTNKGNIYTGVNVENGAYPMTICAERTAVVKAVSEGEKEFNAIAVVTDDGGSPCGACRQVLSEFGLDIIVLIANEKGELLYEVTLAQLLPYAFSLNVGLI